ncbi:AIR carboxylase domain-containing protein [Phthorimaea operculella]|nr:AIR carboxylase domain-containing protein [Phthorimaea operculella]
MTATVKRLPPSKDCHRQKTTTVKRLPPSKDDHRQKTTTVKRLPPSKDFHRQKTATVKILPPLKDFHRQKTATVKRLPPSKDFPSKDFHRQKTTTAKRLPSSKYYHRQKTTTAKRLPPSKYYHRQKTTMLVFEILEKAWALRDCALIDMKIEFGVDTEDYHRQKTTILVFEILEKAWALRDCALIDMKIEFGVDTEGNIVLADIIDSDSWRLWPSGDKRLMVDKQVYRNLTNVTAEALDTVKRNFDWVKDQLDHLKPNVHHKVVIFMGSPADQEHCQKIAKAARDLGLDVELRVTSAHKATEETLRIMQQYEDTHGALVFIAVAGRSNGLGPVLSGNTSYPVINCPPPSDKMVQDIWSSLSVPSGLGCATVIYPDSAALMAAQIIGLQDYLVWARLRVKQLEMAHSLRQADKKLRNLRV